MAFKILKICPHPVTFSLRFFKSDRLLAPVIALLVAVNILRTGWQLLRRSADGLMDVALPAETLDVIEEVMKSYRREGIDFDALRTRQAGMHAFASLHVLVPGDWAVQKGHAYAERAYRSRLASGSAPLACDNAP